MKKFFERAKTVIAAILGIAFAAVFFWGNILDFYTSIMGSVRKFCQFDGAYIYEEENTTVVFTFDGDEMVMYMTDQISSTRIQYEYGGNYYNKGFGGKFLDNDKYWIEIPDADKAGEFFADCESCVATAWGEVQYLDEDQIDSLGEEQGIDYSKTFLFTISGDDLTLILTEAGETVYIPLAKTVVLTGDIGDTVEYLDALWSYEFGE